MDPTTYETIDGLRQKLQAALAVNDSKAQVCHELEIKLKQAQIDRDQLAHDNEKLLTQIDKVQQNDSARRLSSASNKDALELGRRLSKDNASPPEDFIYQQNRRLQNEVRKLKEEIIKIELEKDDFRLKSNLLQEDLDRITLRNEDLKDKADQARRLQDELDEHKHISEKVISYEQMIENLVKKNNELKTELKNLEEKNLSHVRGLVKLEQDNEHLTATINQAGIYKKQLSEAQLKLSEETHRADKAEVELTRLVEKFNATKRENEKLFEATNQLMINNNASKDQQQAVIEALSQRMFESVDLKEVASSSQQYNANTQPNDVINSMSTSVIELKEKVARLAMENQLLETRLNSKPENNKNVLNELLEESIEKCKKLESDNRQARKKIMLLESSLKDLMSQHNSGHSSSMAAAQGFVQYNKQDTSSDNVLALIKRVEDLQRSLYQKDQELREAEAKYKKNIHKAKEVMKALNSNNGGNTAGLSLHPSCMSSASSFNSNSLDETNLLRQQLRDREERLIAMEREFHEFKRLKEVHERLILSAFYSLTTPIQWKNAEKRLEQTTLTSPPNTANSSFNNHFSPGKHASGH